MGSSGIRGDGIPVQLRNTQKERPMETYSVPVPSQLLHPQAQVSYGQVRSDHPIIRKRHVVNSSQYARCLLSHRLSYSPQTGSEVHGQLAPFSGTGFLHEDSPLLPGSSPRFSQ